MERMKQKHPQVKPLLSAKIGSQFMSEINSTSPSNPLSAPPSPSAPPLVDSAPLSIEEKFNIAEGEIPYQEFVKTTFATTNNVDLHQICITMDQLHAIYGFLAEYIEYLNEVEFLFELTSTSSPLTSITTQQIKVEKEIGDLCYYAYMLHNLTTPGTVKLCEVQTASKLDAQKNLELVADLFKKAVWYKHNVDLKGTGYLLLAVVKYLCTVHNKPIEYFILQNKAKLQKRYPSGKFSSQDAAEKKDNL
jgi:hypothetical protein